MLRVRSYEMAVGVFMVFGIISFLILAFKVSGVSGYLNHTGYTVSAEFDHIGDLKVRAPVTIAGVRVGEVAGIDLDDITFRARVKIRLDTNYQNIPDDSSAQILTQGLLGANYISLSPGYGTDEHPKFLKDGSLIAETHSALVLENLISQFLFSSKKDDKNSSNSNK